MKRLSLFITVAMLATVAALVPLAVFAQSGHSVTLTWTASPSAAACVSPCVFGYNVYRGGASGAESATPLNSTPISGLTYVDSTVTLGSSPTSYFYYVEAVETESTVTVSSGPSPEVSATFPGLPVAPPSLTGVPK